jgi:hypothetical protein
MAPFCLAPLIAACWLAAPGSAAGPRAQDVTAALLTRVASMPQDRHNSEIRVDSVQGSDAVHIWINSNEDDTRLYTPAGGQLDMDFQVSALVRPGALPDSVSVRLDTRGLVEPGPGPRALTVRADGRLLPLRQRESPPARSGPLLFLSLHADLSLAEFLVLATSTDVEGRVWDVPFRLLTSQLELLRAWAGRVADTAGVGAE